MSRLLYRARNGLFIAVVGLLCLSLIAPALTLAGPDLTPGEDAVVANTDGDGATLRSEPGSDAEQISNIPEDTPIDIIEGPVPAADGSLWYAVTVNGMAGYIVADFVESAGSGEVPPADDEIESSEDVTTEDADEASELAVQGPAAATIPWQQPAAFGVVVNTTGNVPVDGITCRADANEWAPIITELWEGNTLEVTGEQVFDGTGGGWYPINCAGVGGYVNAAYVQLDAPADEEVVTEEEVTEAEEATEPVVEESITTEVVEEVVTEEVAEVTTETVQVETTEEVVTDAEVVTEEASTDESTDTAEVATEPEAEDATTETETTAEVATETDTETEVVEEAVTEAEAAPVEEVDEAATTESETEVTTESEADTATDVVTETETETVTEAETETTTTTETAEETSTDAASESVTETVTETEPVATTDEVAEESTESEAATETDTAPETVAAPVSTIDVSTAVGSAEVRGTNGDGLKCHTEADATSPIITVLPEGTSVIVMDAPGGSWLNIVCANQLGYADVQYLYAGGAAASDFDASDTGSQVRVQNTGGGGLNCRASASLSGSVITLVPEGTLLTIRGVPTGGWLPVVCAGRNGFVYLNYVSAPTGSSSTQEFSTASQGTATVANTGGDGVRCRSAASTTASIITVLAEGTRVTLRGTPSGGWAPVICASRNGYIYDDYLKIGTSTDSSSGGTTGGTTSGTATVTGTGGGGLNCRAGAGTTYRIITVLAANSTVTLRGAASNGWQPVVCAGQNGYAASQYLTINTGSGTTPTPTPDAGTGSTAGLQIGDHAKTLSNLNVRYSASLGAGVAAVAPAGTVVLIKGNITNGFYLIDWDGLRGYMYGQYLAESNAPLSQRGGSGDSGTTDGGTTGGGSTATGNAIVNFAMGYVGYPYVWATHGPYSFDCSGFTYWVIYNVTGKNIWYGLWTQVSAGTPVSRSNLQPGDLVFFQNTYKAGLSHVGIYIGNNKFIHAQNEATGVVISDLNSTYYGPRWYGAVRIT